MQYGISLIDRASKKVGSDAALARTLGVSRAAISQMLSGRKRVAAEMGVELAVIVGDNVHAALETLLIENAPPEKATRLQKAFQRVAGSGAVAMLIIFAGSFLTAGRVEAALVHSSPTVNTLYIVALLAVALALTRKGWLSLGEIPQPPGAIRLCIE